MRNRQEGGLSLITVYYHAHWKNCIDFICVCESSVNLWKIKAMFCSLGRKIRHNPPILTFNNASVNISAAAAAAAGGANMFQFKP